MINQVMKIEKLSNYSKSSNYKRWYKSPKISKAFDSPLAAQDMASIP